VFKRLAWLKQICYTDTDVACRAVVCTSVCYRVFTRSSKRPANVQH